MNVPNSTESKFVQCNGYFVAIPWKATGGGQMIVSKWDEYAKFGVNDPMLKGHSGPITDFQFNPFIDTFLATASDDGTVGLWTIPVEGITEDLKTPNSYLYGHSKKLTNIAFNPSAEYVLASTSFDKDIRIWDVCNAKEAALISGLIGQPTCLEWNYDGSLLALADKSKKLHIFDPRDTSGAVTGANVHDGPKQIKCTWTGSDNRIITTGVTKQLFKEIAIWDPRDLSTPIAKKKADKNIEVSEPLYDPVNKLCYCAVKGEGRINIWELVDDSEVLHQVAVYRGEGSQRGFNFFPKRFVDVYDSELNRGIRLTDKACQYVSFRLPKKKGAYVPALYGDCPNGAPAKSYDQWMNGESAPAPTIKMDPNMAEQNVLRTEGGAAPTVEREELKTGAPVTASEVSKPVAVSQPVASSAPTPAPSSTAANAAPAADGGVSDAALETIKKGYEQKIASLQKIISSQKFDEPTPEVFDELKEVKNENTVLKSRVANLEFHNRRMLEEIDALNRVRKAKFHRRKAE